MFQEIFLRVRLFYMAKFCIKSTSALKFMIPCHWMKCSIGATCIRGFVDGDQYMQIGIQVPEIVQFISPLPYGILKKTSGRVSPVFDDESGILFFGMAIKIGAS